jgi:hypothetical protein
LTAARASAARPFARAWVWLMNRRDRVIAWLVSACLWTARAVPGHADPIDPLPSMVQRVNNFIHHGEDATGVTLDPRHLDSYPEQIRLSVVSQLAAYCELNKVYPSSTTRQDIVDRANYLVRFEPACRAFNSGDGMLAYALMLAYEATGDATYRDGAGPIVTWCLSMDPTLENPNRVLMAGMALAESYHLTADPATLTKLQAILTLVARMQHADGSFPHGCEAGRDIHYTAWMGMELDRIEQLVDDPGTTHMLSTLTAFLRDRIGLDGSSGYTAPLPSGATMYYYSLPNCPGDYDTRAWTNELAYHALLFDNIADPRYNAVMNRLLALDSQGAFPDKWDFMPPITSTYYAWANSPRSVVRSSVIFWALATIQSDRAAHARANYGVAARTGLPAASLQAEIGTAAVAGVPWLAAPTPNPSRGDTWLTLGLTRPGDVRLTIWDAAGRRVRSLLSGTAGAGAQRLRWDGRDDSGRRAPSGVYLVRMEAEGRVASARLVLID